jgi:uncharacterized membrane protein (DUF2068 family)
MKNSERDVLRLIAVFKLLKAALLIAVGVGALRLLHRDLARLVEYWADALRMDPHNRFINGLLEKASYLTPQRIKELGLGSLAYAAVFLAEGIGLWFLKRWAEWLTVVVTSSLLPIEVYEIYRHPRPLRVAVLAVNVAIVAYLIVQIRVKT